MGFKTNRFFANHLKVDGSADIDGSIYQHNVPFSEIITNAGRNIYVPNASLSTDFIWIPPFLYVDASIIATKVYVDGSLATRDSSIAYINASLGNYATNTSVNNAFTTVNASIGNINSSLGNYATNASVNNAFTIVNASIGNINASLGNYATNASVNVAIAITRGLSDANWANGVNVYKEIFGALYNWYAIEQNDIAPIGWHVPTNADWNQLLLFIDPSGICNETGNIVNSAGGPLKTIGTTYWDGPNIGATDTYGFGLRSVGDRDMNGIFGSLNTTCSLWCYDEGVIDPSTAYVAAFRYDNAIMKAWSLRPSGGPGAYCAIGNDKNYGLPIRLIKDNNVNTGTMTDYDGNIYRTVTIGNQVWMAENLKVEHLNNGTVIPIVTDDIEWSLLTTRGMCYYNNDIEIPINNSLDTINASINALTSPESFQNLTLDNSTFIWDVDLGHNAELLLTTNANISIINVNEGDKGTLIVNQDDTGNKILRLPARSYKNDNWTLSTSANNRDILSFSYTNSNYYWDINKAYVLQAADGSLLFSFMTNSLGDDEFDVTIVAKIPGILNWNLGDSSVSVNSNEFYHTYTVSGIKTVEVYAGTTNGCSDITGVLLPSVGIVGTLDISCFNNMDFFEAHYNPELTQILNPDSSQLISTYYVDNCNLITLDLTNLINIGGGFSAMYNSNLTTILLSTINKPFAYFDARECDLNQVTVDDIFAKLDEYYSSNLPIDELCVWVDGGTNSSPTDCSMNANIVHLQSIFDLAGQSFEYLINCDDSGEKILEFTTNAYSDPFDPTFTVSRGRGRRPLLNWDLGDSSTSVNLNAFSHIYISEGDKTVNVYTGTTLGSSSIIQINMDEDNLVGTLDISCLSNLGTSFSAHINPSLNQVINPISSKIIRFYDLENCDITGTLDLRGLTKLGGVVDLTENLNLQCILNPVSSQVFTLYSAAGCDLTGTLDVSGLRNLGGNFSVNDNSNLITILLPTIGQHFKYFNANNCALDLTTVDGIFAKLDTWYNRHSPRYNLTVDVAGGMNSPPTDCSLNVNIVHLERIFRRYHRTFTYYINCNGVKLFEFTTNASTDTFDPTFDVSPGILNWNLGDTSTSVNSNAFSHTYTTTGNKIVEVWEGSTNGVESIFQINMSDDNLVGILDISCLTNLGGEFLVYDNPDLTSIINPDSSQLFTTYHAWNCDLTEILDLRELTGLGGNFNVNNNPNLNYIFNPTSSELFTYGYIAYDCGLILTLNISGLTGLGGYFEVYNNPSLNFIINPTSSQVFNDYVANDCNLTWTLDISGLTGLGGHFRVYNNPNLNSILNPISSQLFNTYYAYNCDLTGTLDVSGLSNIGGIFRVENNPNLTTILLPTINQEFTLFDASGCGLDLATVDNIFLSLDTWYSGTPPTSNLTINVAGGTNSPPTDCFLNTNIVNLQSIFDNAGKTFTYYVNCDNIKIFEFITEASINNFNTNFAVSSGILNWDLGDSSTSVNSNMFSHTYTILGNKTVTVYSGTTHGSTSITSMFNLSHDELVGTLDISCLTNLGGQFLVCSYSYSAAKNLKLTQIINPVSSQPFSTYWAFRCDLTGTIDLRGLTGLGGNFDVGVNRHLTQILNPDSSQFFVGYWADDCDLTGTLDVSGLINLQGFLRVDKNVHLITILLPTFNQPFSYINANGDALDLFTVDDIFVKLDTWFSSNSPIENLYVDVADGTNSPPTDCSMNANIVHLTQIYNDASLTFTYLINCNEVSVGTKILEFITNASTSAFDPTFDVSSGILNWNLGDSSTSVNANAFSHTYDSSGNKTVQVYVGTTDGSNSITQIYMDDDDIVGVFDISCLSNLGGNFNVNDNTNLTQIINPVSSQIFTNYNAQFCNLTGTLDISGLTGLGGVFYVHYNRYLNYILNPISSQVFSVYDVERCDLIDTLDLTGLTGLGGLFDANNNQNLHQIFNPDSSQVFTTYNVQGCDLTGILNVSGLSNLSGSFLTYNNPNLTHITLPTINQQFTLFDASGCGLDLATVNDIFANLDAWYSGIGHEPSANLIVNVANGTNSPPTDCSMNTNIVHLTSIFNDASLVFTYYINCSDSIIEYHACEDYQPYFATTPADGPFLDCSSLISDDSTIGDYVIEWRLDSSQGTTVFISGEGSDPSIQSQHPFPIPEPVFGGTLYPVIMYIYIDSSKYSSYYDVSALYSPDLINCLDPVIISSIDCNSSLGADPIYPYYLVYNNVTDQGLNKSRTLRYTICDISTNPIKYLAWEFDGYYVAEQLKIYYCTSTNSSGVLIDNFIHGTFGPNNTYLTNNFYPENYPDGSARIYLRVNADGYYGIKYITKFDDVSYNSDDYLKIEIIGSVYDPTQSNTNWYLKLKSISSSDISCNWLYDSSISKIIDDPSIVLDTTSAYCYYKLSYNTTSDSNPPSKVSPSAPFIWKYLQLGSTYTSGYAGAYYNNPVRLGLPWYTNNNQTGIYTSGHSYTLCTNCNSGQSITYTLQTADISAIVITCTDTSDYDIFVSGINYVKNSSQYLQWLTTPDTSIGYYSYYDTWIKNASSCGDTAMGYDYFYTHFSADVSWDPITKTIVMPLVQLTNNIVDTSCDISHTKADTLIGQFNILTNRLPFANYLPFTSQTRVPNPIGGIWLSLSDTHGADTGNLYYSYRIHDVMLNDMCDLTPYGFMYDMSIGGTVTTFSNYWTLFRYWDRFTLLDTDTPESRLANWRLERRKFLRTDIATDTEWEIVYDVST